MRLIPPSSSSSPMTMMMAIIITTTTITFHPLKPQSSSTIPKTTIFVHSFLIPNSQTTTIIPKTRTKLASATMDKSNNPSSSSSSSTPLIPSPESTFWYTLPPPPLNDNPLTTTLPSSLTLLDPTSTGSLPTGSYRPLGYNTNNEPVNACILSLSPVIDEYDDCRDVLRGWHSYIDGGFNSFVLKGRREEEFYGRYVRRETPLSLLEEGFIKCCWRLGDLNYENDGGGGVWGSGGGNVKTMVRREVTERLRRLGRNELDCWQLDYNPKSFMYHLDTLDALADLKREGLIHTITTKQFPLELLQYAKCYFENDLMASLDGCYNVANQRQLLPRDYHLRRRCDFVDDDGMTMRNKLSVESPLAGGLFVDEWGERVRRQSNSGRQGGRQGLSTLSSRRWEGLSVKDREAIQQLKRCHYQQKRQRQEQSSSCSFWDDFDNILSTLHTISQKHEQSISTIALRFILEELNDDLGTVTISSGSMSHLGFFDKKGEESLRQRQQQQPYFLGGRYDRVTELRRCLTFELEEEDRVTLRGVGFGVGDGEDEEEEEIDFSDQRLWL